jgi:hypothetical protein
VVALGGDDPFPSWNEVRELDLLLLPLRLDRLVDARHYLGSHRAFGNAAADDDERHLRERWRRCAAALTALAMASSTMQSVGT